MKVETKDRDKIREIDYLSWSGGRAEISSYSGEVLISALRTFPEGLYPRVFSITIQNVDDVQHDSIHDGYKEWKRFDEETKARGILPFSEVELEWDEHSGMFLPRQGIKISQKADLKRLAKAMQEGLWKANTKTYRASFWNDSPFKTFIEQELEGIAQDKYHVEWASLDLKSHRESRENDDDFHDEACAYLSHHPGIAYGKQHYVKVGTNGLGGKSVHLLNSWLSALPVKNKR